MENEEEIMELSAEVARLRDQQRNILTFVSAQFAELFAMTETVIDLQKTMLIGQFGETPELDAKAEALLTVHRTKYVQLVREDLEHLGFLGDSSQGPEA